MKYKITIIFLLILSIFIGNYGLNKDKTLKYKINNIFSYKFESLDGKDIKTDSSVFTMLDPDELLLRSYLNKKTGKIINLSIVLTNKRDHIHDPEICYRGQGINMDKEKPIKFGKNNDAVFVYGKKNEHTLKVIYWYTDLKKTYSSRYEFMKQVMTSAILNKPLPAFALVIVSGYDFDDKDLFLFSDQVNTLITDKL